VKSVLDVDIRRNVEDENMDGVYKSDRDDEPKEAKVQPVVGEVVRIKVIGLGKKGDFFGKYNGLVVFIKAKEAKLPVGSLVTLKIIEVRNTCAFGELV